MIDQGKDSREFSGIFSAKIYNLDLQVRKWNQKTLGSFTSRSAVQMVFPWKSNNGRKSWKNRDIPAISVLETLGLPKAL